MTTTDRAAVSQLPARGSAARPPSLGRKLTVWFADWSLALPLIIVFGVLLITPALAMIHQSVTDEAGRLTLEHWNHAFLSRSARRAVGHTLILAATVATLTALEGAPLAWILSRIDRVRRALALGILNVAINLSAIGLGFAYVATLGNYGMVTLALHYLGIDIMPPAQGSFWGLTLAYVYSNVPLFVLLVLPAMGLLREEWWEAAQTSAASRLQFWRYVGWPVLKPFVLADWLLIFTWSVGMYGLPVALVGSKPGAYRVITVEMSRSLLGSLFGERNTPVYAVVLMGIAVISLLTYRFAMRRGTRWLR